LLAKLGDILTLAYELVSTKKLKTQLPFTLSIKKAESEAERRISKIFNYNAFEYNTTALLGANWKGWEENPSSFWVQLKGQQSFKFDNAQYEVLFACLQLEQSDAHSRILRRFYTIVYYRSRQQQSQNDSAQVIARVFYHALYPNASIDEKILEQLVDGVEGLIQAGSRYNHLGERLGYGSLFCLGEEIPRTV
jgi:hypothetical protein